MRFWLTLLTIFVVGCTTKNSKCGNKALLLWPNAQGAYVFQEVPLQTLNSPYRLQGEAAEIYYENGLDTSSFFGSVAEPHLTDSDGVCVPRDIGSSLALNAYAQFEKLYLFERDLGTAQQILWPRRVGVETHLAGSSVDTQNNAHYYGNQDLTTLVPYTGRGVPVSLNQGIVAHEHFHSHFQAMVIRKLNLQQLHVEDLAKGDLQSAQGLNNFVLRGWNEGLADFFAGIYTGRADYFEASLSAPERNLSGPLSLMMSGDVLSFQTQAPRGASGRNLVRVLTNFSYSQGSILARLLFGLAQSGEEPPKIFLKRVMLNLPRIADFVLPEYTARVMDFEMILPLVLKDIPLTAEGCEHIQMVSSKGLFHKEFPQCRK